MLLPSALSDLFASRWPYPRRYTDREPGNRGAGEPGAGRVIRADVLKNLYPFPVRAKSGSVVEHLVATTDPTPRLRANT